MHAVLCSIPLLAVTGPLQEPPQPAVLAPPVQLQCDTGPIDTGAHIGHAGPLLADLDGDGRRELLVGNFRGHFQLYADAGERGAPKFVARGLLRAAGEEIKIHNW